MSTRNHKKRKAGRKQDMVRRNRFEDQVPHPATQVHRSPVDPEALVRIPFTIVGSFANAATYQTQAYKINSLADSNIVYLGISAWASLYTKYRVVAVKTKIDACGTNQLAQWIGAFGFSPLSTAIASATDVLNFARMTNSVGVTVGAVTGSSIERLHLSARLVNVEGTENVLTDNDYTAATSAVADPASLIYLHVASRSFSGGSTAQGLAFKIYGTMEVQFFERKNII